MKKITILLLTICISQIIVAQSRTLTNEQKEYLLKFIYPIKTFEPEEKNTEDLLILDKFIGNAKIVGLGESTHGSSEIYKMKDRISRYLINNKKFNVFSLEANMPESYLMNNYILNNQGNPKEILKGMYFWIWQTQETLNFIEWMKEYNQNHNSKAYFDGFDLQFQFGALKQIKEIYTKNNLNIEEYKNLVNILKENNRGQRSYKQKQQKIINELLEKTKEKVVYIQDNESKKRFIQNIRIIEQNIQVGNAIKRDKFMAENIKWIYENYENPKIIVSAHNFHISKWNKIMMGNHLNEEFGENYVNFGFAFYNGSYTGSIQKKIQTLIAQTAYEGTLEYYLNSLNIPIFILDLKSIKKENNKLIKDLFTNILARKTGSGPSGNEFRKTNVLDSFDYLIFINRSTNSILLN